MAENPKKAAAKAEYLKRRARGEKINLSELAAQVEVSRSTLHRWISTEGWDDIKPRRQGGQLGNQNAKGNPGGAPPGNKNAEKDGAYSAIFFNTLTDDEKQLAALTPLESLPALQHEMIILKLREKRVLDKISAYEAEDENKMFPASLVDFRKPFEGEDGAVQKYGMYSSDSAFERLSKLYDALYKIQGRIAAVANSIRSIEEASRREALERERLDIMRLRAYGVAEMDEGGEDEIIHE